MKLYFIATLISFCFISVNIVSHSQAITKEQINIQSNNADVASNEVCYVIYDPAKNYDDAIIICEKESDTKAKLFKNVGKIIGASTGTPGWLAYDNYIGYKIIDDGKPGLSGGGKRVIFCDGPCRLKE
jgi:hypothetical protein